MDKEKLTYGLAIAGFWLNVIFGGLAAWINVAHMLWVPFLLGASCFLVAIALWDYRNMTKVQMVKQLARLFFAFGLGAGVAGVLWNWYQGNSSTLWIFGFLIAFASALVGIFYGANVNWKELRDRREDDRASRPRRYGDGPYPTIPNPRNDPKKNHSGHPSEKDAQFMGNSNQQQFAIAGNSGGKAFNLEWRNSMITALNKHFLLIAGILLAIITASYGMFNHSEAADWTVLTLLIVATIAVLLASSGVLKSFLQETLTNHFAKAWLFVSLVVALLLWKYAHDDGFTLGEMPQVWIALTSALVAGLITLGLLRPLLQAVGVILRKAYGFGYHPFLTLVLWGMTLLFGYAFVNLLFSQEIFGLDVSDQVFQVTIWIGISGAVLVIFSALAFKGK